VFRAAKICRCERPDEPPTRTNYGQDDPAADVVVRETVAVANEVSVSSAQIALAWLRARPSPIIPIVGAPKLTQLEDNLRSLSVVLSSEQLERCPSHASGANHRVAIRRRYPRPHRQGIVRGEARALQDRGAAHSTKLRPESVIRSRRAGNGGPAPKRPNIYGILTMTLTREIKKKEARCGSS
jgi:hypothetical protein